MPIPHHLIVRSLLAQCGIVLAAALALVSPAHASIVAIAADVDSGEIAIAAASCDPDGALDLPFSVLAGRAVLVQQGNVSDRTDSRKRVADYLATGNSPAEVVRQLQKLAEDERIEQRQYLAMNLTGAASAHNGSKVPSHAMFRLAGPEAIQGNHLPSAHSLDAAIEAMTDARNGGGAASDVAVVGLARASEAGGDERCTSSRLKQTANHATLVVVRRDDGTVGGLLGAVDGTPTKVLDAREPSGGRNAVATLIARYRDWRRDHVESDAPLPSLGAVPAGDTSPRAIRAVGGREGALALLVIAAAAALAGTYVVRKRRGGRD